MSDLESAVAIDSYEDIVAEDFLELVWGDREGWIDLPTKVGKYWVSFYVEWPNDEGVTRRIDSALRDREDIYYSVAQFRHRGRKIEDVLPTDWLWADLDFVHPTAPAELGFLPTVAVESSPGRYQALWKLTRRLAPKDTARLCRALTYAVDADHGGWDLTQVLRIAGTRNFKYPEAPVVRVLWIKPELVYDPRRVWETVRRVVPRDLEFGGGNGLVDVPRVNVPPRARALLRTAVDQVVEGERSARLWELECLLAESGLTEDEVYALVRVSAWNKWRGTGESGRRRLRADVRKAMAHVRRRASLEPSPPQEVVQGEAEVGENEEQAVRAEDVTTEEGEDRLPWVGYSTFMAMRMEEPKWLIENIWTAGSHGIIGGEPKTSKTTLALALGLSVASGQPFLGEYAVGVTGPALIVQEENAPWMMQDRLRKLAAYGGLIEKGEAHVHQAGAGALGKVSIDLDFPQDIPLKLLNNYGFDLGVDEHQEMLWAEIEDVRPKVLILDPLYLILPADTNSSDELRRFLKWLLRVRNVFDCAVILVHHMSKAKIGRDGKTVGNARPGQRLLGSTILHGWADSAIYCSRRDDFESEWLRLMVEREFRSMAPQKPIELGIKLGSPGSLDAEIEVIVRSLESVILEIVREDPGITSTAVGKLLDKDRRTIEARCRGGELGIVIEKGTGGRGHAAKLFPPKER